MKWFHLVLNCYYASGLIHIKFQVEIESADDKQQPGINQPPVAEPVPPISDPNAVPERKDPVISGAPNQNPPEVVPPPEPTPIPAASGEQSEIEQMVLSQLKATPAASTTTAPAANGVGLGEKVNWSTHKNEGMRLTRFVESNAAQFPHMAQMFESGNKKEWVFRFDFFPYKFDV